MSVISEPKSQQVPPTAQPAGVPLIDIARENGPLREEIDAAIRRVCDSGWFVMGPSCGQLEEAIATYCGSDAAIGCASGSDALLLALMAVGVEAGDEVILPSYTFFATAGAVSRLGAKPVFAEIEPVGYNIDPASIEALVTPATKAIIPVHLYGQCADMDAINEIARRHSLAVVEDAAQAIGAEYHGRRAGSLSDVSCFSFYPTKNLACFGDGGMLTTSRPDLAQRLRLLRAHGMEPRYHHKIVGVNSRLDTLQAAVLGVKLQHLDRWTAARQANAERYGELFARFGLDAAVGLPAQLPNRRHVWNQYVVRIGEGRRDALRAHLAEHRVGTEIYYPIPLHSQECYASLGYEAQSLPVTSAAARETLALPIFPELTAAEQETVVRHIAEFLGK